MSSSEPPSEGVRRKKKRCSLERRAPLLSCRNGGHHRNQQLENSGLGVRRHRPATGEALTRPHTPPVRSVSPNSNPVRETVVTIDLLSPVRPDLLNLMNRLLTVLDGIQSIF
ncbi:hypothetical protein GQ457_07G009700 [Hibiscus cannabinus]